MLIISYRYLLIIHFLVNNVEATTIQAPSINCQFKSRPNIKLEKIEENTGDKLDSITTLNALGPIIE